MLNEPAVPIVTKNVSELFYELVTYILNEPDTPIVTKDESESYNSRVPCVENESKY